MRKGILVGFYFWQQVCCSCDSYLPPFRLVFDVVCRSNFGFDIFQVWQWLVNKPKLLRSSGGFWRSTYDGNFLLTGHQDGRFGGSWCVRGPGVARGSRSAWRAWRIAWWGARSDGSWSRGSGCGSSTLSCSANRLWPYINEQNQTKLTPQHQKILETSSSLRLLELTIHELFKEFRRFADYNNAPKGETSFF